MKNEDVIEIMDSDISYLPINSVRYFGNDINSEFYKTTGGFKKFNSISWVKDHQGNRYYVDLSIGKLKKYFDNYDSIQKKHRAIKKGKQVTAIAWQCEVLINDVRKLNPKQATIAKNAVEAHTWFTLDGKFPFYYLCGKFFKDAKNEKIVYIDTHNNIIVNVDIAKRKQEEFFKWEKRYLKENVNK
ncbi:MAG: hypothetical protein ACOC3V_03495 [bacterium]